MNVGIFLELTEFRAAAGDETLKEHILKAPSKAKYMFKTIQNELICLCGEEIVTGIISEVKESRVFSILADEVTDCSNTEQMSFVIRSVDNSCQIREKIIQFLVCESGTSGQELYLKIVNAIRNLGLEINKLRRQGCDNLTLNGNFKPQLQTFEFCFNGNIISSEKSLSPPFSHRERYIHHFLLACNLLETCSVVLYYQFIQSIYRPNKLKT